MKFFKLGLAALALTFSAAAMAQEENRQTLIIEGSGIQDVEDVFTHYPTAANYRIFVEFDTSVPLDDSSPTSKIYSDAVISVEIRLYDEQDQLVEGPEAIFDGDDPENAGIRPSVYFERTETTETVRIQEIFSPSATIFWFGSILQGPAGSLFADFSGFPQFVEGPVQGVENGYTHFDSGQSQEMVHFDVFGPVSSLSYLVLDADGDGVVDSADACPVSIMDETVLFDGWYDSGVTNYVDANGCTVTDHYAACEAEEQEAPTRGIRSVRSGPSSCEKAVSYDLVADGVISYSEARALRDALYESSSSNLR